MSIEFYLVCHSHGEKGHAYTNHPGEHGSNLQNGRLGKFLEEHLHCHLVLMHDGCGTTDDYRNVAYSPPQDEDDDIPPPNNPDMDEIWSEISLRISKKMREYFQEIQDIRRDNESLNSICKKYHDSLGIFLESETLPSKLESLHNLIQGTQNSYTNVYSKFMELEKRQKEIETLMNSEKVLKILKAIPEREELLKIIEAIDDLQCR